MGITAKEIRTLMHDLERAAAGPVIIDILTQLQIGVEPTEKLLRETKLGIAVNKLRTHSDKKISDLVKSIIKKWKDEVTAQKSRNAQVAKSASSVVSAPTTQTGLSTPSTAAPTTSQPPTANAKPASQKEYKLPGGGVRSVKTDKVTTDIYGDRVRNSCVEVTYNALAHDSTVMPELVLATAKEVERAVFMAEKGSTPTYRSKMRSLFLNLKDPKNPKLRLRVVSGEISAERLYKMTPQEMASEELKSEIKRLEQKNLFNAQGAKEERAVTDRFTCGKCKQKKVSYYQMQTRSADEPLTTFCTCENCGNRWKFS
ncbi:transcription factor S-II, central domain-containing protein [Lipomyces oligophaga]|uniref:transcription factor S-II, central domain-containing protein n=1 Tax=Lipomyces oligophaga TaxID=45792 RepID=UPI0034CD4E12